MASTPFLWSFNEALKDDRRMVPLDLPSQQLPKQQPDHPTHHLAFSHGKDSMTHAKGTQRGHPQRYRLDMTSKEDLVVLNAYLGHNALDYPRGFSGLEKRGKQSNSSSHKWGPQ